MRLTPIHCAACSQFSLVEHGAIDPHGSGQCECGAVGRALPSGTFGMEDRDLFDAIAQALARAPINWMNATRLSIELQASSSPIGKLSALKQRVPSLGIITKIAGSSPATARKASAIFQTLLEAIAHTRTRSDVSSLAPPSTSRPAVRGLRGR